MSKRRSFDEREFLPVRVSDTLDRDGELGAGLGALRTPIPSAPGSETSEAAADALEKNGTRQRELRRVLIWFAAQSEPRTTHEMASVLYPDTGTGSACPRVNELVFLGCLERVGKQGKRSTLAITAKGRGEADRLSRWAA